MKLVNSVWPALECVEFFLDVLDTRTSRCDQLITRWWLPLQMFPSVGLFIPFLRWSEALVASCLCCNFSLKKSGSWICRDGPASHSQETWVKKKVSGWEKLDSAATWPWNIFMCVLDSFRLYFISLPMLLLNSRMCGVGYCRNEWMVPIGRD